MAPTDDEPPCVLVMDANERNAALLADFLETEGYEPQVRTTLDVADEVVTDPSRFAFAIIDIDRFASPVCPYCDQLHEQDVPFIVLSGFRTPSLRRESREHGAHSFVEKPISKQELHEFITLATDKHD